MNLGGPINFIFSAADRKIGVFDVNKESDLSDREKWKNNEWIPSQRCIDVLNREIVG